MPCATGAARIQENLGYTGKGVTIALIDSGLSPSEAVPAARILAESELRARVEAAGYEPPATYFLEHGYCRSLYVVDPAGLIVEFTVDHPDVDKINADQLSKAHSELARWLAGDHSPNNEAYHR